VFCAPRGFGLGSLESTHHVVLEGGWKIDIRFIEPHEGVSMLHYVPQLIETECLGVISSGDEPVCVQARDVKPEIQVPEDEGIVEAIGKVLSHKSAVFIGKEIVNRQFSLKDHE